MKKKIVKMHFFPLQLKNKSIHVSNTSWAERSAPPSVAGAARRRPRGQRSTENFQVFNFKFSPYRKIVSLNPGRGYCGDPSRKKTGGRGKQTPCL